MRERARRLARIASAQGTLSSVLEAKLRAEERLATRLLRDVEETAAAVDRQSASLDAFRAAGLRRLIATREALRESEARAAAIRASLLAARSRQKASGALAVELARADDRKEEQENALETALGMMGKASRKASVLD